MAPMIDAIGLALLAGSAAAALLCLLAWRGRGRARGIVLGASLALFLLLARPMLERLLPALVAAPPGLRMAIDQGLAALAAFAAAFALDQAIRRYLWYGRLRDGDHSRVPTILIGLASAGGYALTGLLVASLVLGLDVTAVAATSGVVAIVLGVSAQQTLGQVFAGLALNMARPFRLGDSLQIDGVWGVVEDADWRAVTLRTYEGTLVTLPNMLVASQRVTNLGDPGRAIRHAIPFVADAEVPPGRVRAVALAALAAQPQVLAAPAPLLLAKGFEDRGVLYEALFWARDPNLTILRRDEAAQALWYAFARAGIPFALHRRLLALPDGARPPVPPEDPAEAAARLLGWLRRSPLYASFPAAELEALAQRARCRAFAAGERIMRQGAAGASMFVVLEGQVSVRLEGPDGAEAEIYTQGEGETFGHLSALVGAPRVATVRAMTHLLAAEIGRDGLAPLIAAHPELVEVVARETLRIEEAQMALGRARAAGMEAGGADQAGILDRLAERIRAFLGAGRGH